MRRAAFVLPNLFTLSSLFCGFFSIAQSFGAGSTDELHAAAIAILYGAFFDAFDGRVARLTRTQTALGLELDSLCDVVTFGVAPASLVYNWGLERLGLVGMLISFVWIAAGALRLARFNVLAQRAEAKPGKYIVGLPIPMAAMVIVALVVLANQVGGERYILGQGSLALVVLGLSFLMVSRIRFRSFKDVKWRSRKTLGLILLLGVSSTAVWVGLRGAHVFLFLLAIYISLGIAETLLWRHGDNVNR